MRPEPKGLHHDHIDGSAAVIPIIDLLYDMADETFPFRSIREWIRYMRSSGIPIPERFDTITRVLQTREALETLGYTYGEHRANEGYTYVEGKFAPQYSQRKGLTIPQAIRALREGLVRAEREFGIRIFPHICIGREADPDTGVEIARAVLEYDGEIALDLACDEANNSPEKHLSAYRLTFGSNVKRDCHAGEFVAGNRQAPQYRAELTQNIMAALFSLQCHGISHAIPLVDQPGLVGFIADHGIRVAGCPLSNMSEGHINCVGELGIDELLDAGVIYTLNPDDDLFLPPMHEVVEVCDKKYEFTHQQKRALEENVFKGAWGLP